MRKLGLGSLFLAPAEMLPTLALPAVSTPDVSILALCWYTLAASQHLTAKQQEKGGEVSTKIAFSFPNQVNGHGGSPSHRTKSSQSLSKQVRCPGRAHPSALG